MKHTYIYACRQCPGDVNMCGVCIVMFSGCGGALRVERLVYDWKVTGGDPQTRLQILGEEAKKK